MIRMLFNLCCWNPCQWYTGVQRWYKVVSCISEAQICLICMSVNCLWVNMLALISDAYRLLDLTMVKTAALYIISLDAVQKSCCVVRRKNQIRWKTKSLYWLTRWTINYLRSNESTQICSNFKDEKKKTDLEIQI